jgi:hypothetical protein
MGKLTKRAIDALTAPGKGEIFVWDTELRGFGLRVKSTGRKTCLVQYRNAEPICTAALWTPALSA